MAGICPHCKEKISILKRYQKVEIYSRLMLDKDKNVVESEKEILDATDWGVVECPECTHEFKDITDDEKAEEFLRGKGVLNAKHK